ncbi:MAG: cyclase family protein [Anaerolineaceae bacterium]|nr:cyclase family protein [Anaerolineaceae bacterium]
MLIDITLLVTPEMIEAAHGNEQKSFSGHMGTHFDVMNKVFPLENLKRSAVVFDVSKIEDREISLEDVDLNLIESGMFVAFYSGFIEKVGYGGKVYFSEHPQLSDTLIDALLERHVSIIGVDFAGVRRGSEHTPKDQYCADCGVFIVENLCNLNEVLQGKPFARFTANTYPIKYADMTGLPCRVVAEI